MVERTRPLTCSHHFIIAVIINGSMIIKVAHQVTEPLYPIVCSTAAKTEMALGVLKRDFLSLQVLHLPYV